MSLSDLANLSVPQLATINRVQALQDTLMQSWPRSQTVYPVQAALTFCSQAVAIGQRAIVEGNGLIGNASEAWQEQINTSISGVSRWLAVVKQDYEAFRNAPGANLSRPDFKTNVWRLLEEVVSLNRTLINAMQNDTFYGMAWLSDAIGGLINTLKFVLNVAGAAFDTAKWLLKYGPYLFIGAVGIWFVRKK